MKVFVGLGNPGDKYKNTRHNIGFMVADSLRDHFNFDKERTKFDGHLSEGVIDSQKVLIFKPQTYMNDSGRALGKLVRYFNVAPEDIIVFYDELDLPLGKLRVRLAGGDNGHNGVRSCVSHLGKNFYRIRLGIGRPEDKDFVNGYVLSPFAKSETDEVVSPWLEAIVANASLLVRDEPETFANKLHLAMEAAIKN